MAKAGVLLIGSMIMHHINIDIIKGIRVSPLLYKGDTRYPIKPRIPDYTRNPGVFTRIYPQNTRLYPINS